MDLKKYAAVFAILLFVIFCANHYINQALEEKEREAKLERMKTVALEVKKPEPQTSDLYDNEHQEKLAREMSKYGITITPKELEPVTPEGWEQNIRSAVEKNKVFEGEAAQKSLTAMQVTPQEYEKDADTLDKDIKTVLDQINQDPFNDELKGRLQNLYKLKGLAKVLKEKVVVENPVPKDFPVKIPVDNEVIPPSVPGISEVPSK